MSCEKTLKTEYVYKGKILNLRNDEAVSFDGKPIRREIVEHNGGSAILCVKDGKVLLVRQYRYAFGKEIWEIPAGKRDKDESFLQAAFRELNEECGIKAEKMELMYTAYPSPGYTEEKICIFRAENLSNGEKHFDEDENIESRWIELSVAKEMIKSGEINDAKTLIAILGIEKDI